MALPVALAFAAAVVLVEMAYRASAGSALKLFGMALDTRSAGAWIAAFATLAAAYALCRWAWRGAQPRWAEVSAAIGDAR
jgi:hypothetical protein